MLLDLGKYQDALAAFDKALELEPAYTEVFYYKGFALQKIGRYQEAVEAFERNLEKDMSNSPGYYFQGYRTLQTGALQGRSRSF